MKPGLTTRPSASTVWPAAPDNLPISTILPSLIATSPWKPGMPEPSMMRPFRINTSYAISVPPRSCRANYRRFAATITRRRPPAVDLCAPGQAKGGEGGVSIGPPASRRHAGRRPAVLLDGNRVAGRDLAALHHLGIDAHEIVAEAVLQAADDVE